MKTILFLLSALLSLRAMAQEKDSLMDVVFHSQSIFPMDKNFLQAAGSFIYIDSKKLKEFNYGNINRILEASSGVHLYEEDGFGLRPNISIRGSAPERSRGINLMEDGIPIAPAPYSASEAYYFPNISRMKGVEILKGSGQIKYGPNTVGGSVNLLSAPTPQRLKANAEISVGRFQSTQSEIYMGNKTGKFSYMVQFLFQNAMGFKHLPNGNDTGFTKLDGLAKLNYSHSIAHNIPFSIQLKYQASKEDSHETYLGITDSDFSQDAFQRYQASSKDNMKNNHDQWVLSGQISPLHNLQISLDAYTTRFKRNWYKSQSINAGNGNIDLGSIVHDTQTYDAEFAIMKGSYSENGFITLRNNNRKYGTLGAQLQTSYRISSKNFQHEFHAGLRFHKDFSDRFQWDDKYKNRGNTLGLYEPGTPGTQSNFIDAAKAFSAYFQYQMEWKKWTITSGFRMEDILLERKNYGADLNREGEALLRENKNQVLIPGFSFTYNWNEKWEFFSGVHKGFSPSGNTPGQSAELSWNYEMGGRWENNQIKAELIGYVNDYSNLLGSDLNAQGGEGNNELYNAGAVLVWGIESQFQYKWKFNDNFSMPIQFNYTLIQSQFKDTFQSDLYGNVAKGDHLPNLPKHQFKTQLGGEFPTFSAFISYKFLGERRTEVGQGTIEDAIKIKAYSLVDISLRYNVLPHFTLFSAVENVFNNTYNVSRLPYGMRPGMPFFIKAGASVSF